MCRIFGISYDTEREAIDTAKIASILYPALVHQGPHAWGWMSYNEANEGIDWEKTSGRCDTKEARKQQRKFIDKNAKWFVGHLRYATHGRPDDNRNNHPIPHANIVGVHNGVLRNHNEILKKTGREDPKAIVDSEAIFAAVNKWGPSQGLARIRGDMVTVYADVRRPHVLHIARSFGRQITLGTTEKGNLIFASEQQALERLEKHGIKFVKFSTVSENRLLIIRNGKIIQRHRFAPKSRSITYTAPPASVLRDPSVTVRRDAILAQYDEAAARIEAMWAQEKAKKRGDILFPRGTEERRSIVPRTTEDRRRAKKKGGGRNIPVMVPTDIVEGGGKLPKRRQPNQNEKGRDTFYYWHGMLLTEEEYIEAINSDF